MVMKKSENKLALFLKNYGNVSLIAILIIATIIRFYYLFTTSGQPLWWDEAEYMATAVHWASDVPYNLNPQRPPLFQFFSAIIFNIGLGEQTIKFLLVSIPSIFLVFSVYLLGKEMYGRKIGIIAAFLTAISWSLVFWSARVQPDFFSLSFQLISILFMWKFWKNGQSKLVLYSGFFAALGFYFKVSALLVPLTFILFIFIKDRLSAFKNKNYWMFSIAFLITLAPYFIWSLIQFGDPLAFRAGYSNQIISPTHEFAWNTLSFFYSLTDDILFWLFIFGLIMSLKFIFYLDVLSKNKEKCFDPDLFGIILLVVVSAFYIFYIRGVEDRWVFLWLPFIFFFAAKSLVSLEKTVSKKDKTLAGIIVMGLLLAIFFLQVSHFHSLIENKKTTYAAVKEVGLWLQDNANPGDKLISQSYTQSVYYSHLNVSTLRGIENAESFDKYLAENNPKYLQVSAFETHPEWINSWVQSNQNNLIVVAIYYADQSQTQPVLILYELPKIS